MSKKIKVKNRISGKIYECSEDQFLRAVKNGAALMRLAEPKKEIPSFKKEEPKEEAKSKPKTKK